MSGAIVDVDRSDVRPADAGRQAGRDLLGGGDRRMGLELADDDQGIAIGDERGSERVCG